ncbi:hypothetical protein RB195_020539 [Necator americanus]
MRILLCTVCAILPFLAQISADEEGVVKAELNDESKQILKKVTELREQGKKELEKISEKEERDLVETMAIEAEVKDLKAATVARPKRDTPPTLDLFSLLKPKTSDSETNKARQARQALAKARRARRNKQRRAAAAARRKAKARQHRAAVRARITASRKRAADAKREDQLKKE